MSNIGATFSHHQITNLGLSVEESLTKVLALELAYLRLACHWSEVESSVGEYDFTQIERLLSMCDERGQAVVLTLGVKAPRWPEFYWPEWLSSREASAPDVQSAIGSFVSACVTSLRQHACIKYWQVENEPLDPSGPDHTVLPMKLLSMEVDLVRSLDPRPIILTAWGNELVRRKTLPQLAPLADVIGIDLYDRQYSTTILGKHIYRGPEDSPQDLRRALEATGKKYWIMELQAEPWEKDEASYLSDEPASMSPQRLHDHLTRARLLGAECVMLWGIEYALFRAHKEDQRYMAIIERLHDDA